LFEELHAQSRITTYDWTKYDGNTAVFLPKLMTAEQLQEGTRRIGVNFFSTARILGRFWTNRHHPFVYLATSFAWRHQCRKENCVPFFARSGSWRASRGKLILPEPSASPRRLGQANPTVPTVPTPPGGPDGNRETPRVGSQTSKGGV
jgi:hypothetical protein